MGSGLQWIKVYNEGRTPAEQVKFATSEFLTGWEWPRRPTDLLMLKDGSTVEGEAIRSGRNTKVTKPDGSIVEVPNDQIKEREEGQNDEKLIKPSTLKFLKWGTIAIGVAMFLGIFPWRWPFRARMLADPDERFSVARAGDGCCTSRCGSCCLRMASTSFRTPLVRSRNCRMTFHHDASVAHRSCDGRSMRSVG